MKHITLSIGMMTAAFVLALPSGALKPATMKLPAEVAGSLERLPAKGFGGANRGRFVLDAYTGDFTRIESRLSIFDPLYTVNRGRGSFTLEGPGIDGTISGECEPKQRVVTIGVVTFDPKKLAYVCAITQSGAGEIGNLTIGEPRPENFRARLVALSVRRGELNLGDTRLEIASVHQHEGARFQVQYPVGYLFSDQGRIVGGLELTDVNPTVLLENAAADHVRAATLVAALALSVFRDPADSALGD